MKVYSENIDQLKYYCFRAVLCFFAVLMLAACSKEELSQREINTNLLAGKDRKTWHIVSATYNDIEYLPDCVKDDDWVFERLKRVSRRNTSESCEVWLSNIEEASWTMNNEGSRLSFFGVTFKIVTLTENDMVLEFVKDGNTHIHTFRKK